MKEITRRRWLKGALSATLALPFLEYFTPTGAFAQATPGSKPRLLVYFLPNGRVPEWWVPTGGNGNLTFPAEASALQPFASRALEAGAHADARAGRE